MEDIYALLNINKGVLQDFHLQAERVVDHQTELAINRNIRSLQEVEERMLTDKNVNVSQQTIDEIIMKVIENAKNENKDMSIWSIRELRIVSYYLMKLQGHEDAYMYALSLLDANWRDMFFNGLSFYCLDTWTLIDPELRVLTCELLNKKLQQYKDGNKKYMTMKNHANFFDEAGPRRMSALLIQKNMDIKDAPTFFKNKPSTLSQSFYSDVIVNYCAAKKITDNDVIEEIFELHNSDRTKKLVLADLVDRVNDYGDDMKRTLLCKFANRMLGDITLSSTWAPFLGATDKEVQKLRKAKQLVNLWFNQKIIETFFDVCVQDRDRKIFWLKYVSHVSSFKIVGSTATKRLLQGDSRVSGIFLPHYIETNSYSSQTSALVLFIRNKMIVEFSDTGALYVYNQNHSKVKLVTNRKRDIGSTADLKIPSMDNLIYISDWGGCSYYEEGRMTHQGHWQSRLDGWMQRIALSSSNTGSSFIDSKDDELFKAKPVPKEEFKPKTKPVQKSLFDDLPEYERPVEQHRPAPKPQVSSPQKTQATPKLKSVVYEDNIDYKLSSKWVFNDKCRVVLNYRGTFLNVQRGRKFVNVRNPMPGIKLKGSIWIKRPNALGWMEIVHSTGNQEVSSEYSLGYIREGGGYILYKQSLSQTDFMKINC